MLELAQFPSEVLARITSHLPGFVLLRTLYETGSKVLWHKLKANGVIDIHLNRDVTKDSDILKLKSFQGLLSVTAEWHLVPSNQLKSLLDILPSSLTWLHLEHTYAEKAMVLELPKESLLEMRNRHFHHSGKTVWNLSERLPCLKHLHLEGEHILKRYNVDQPVWTFGMFLLFLRLLPRGLEYLHLGHLGECELPWRQYLPPHLTHLSRNLMFDVKDATPELYPSSLMQSLLHCSFGFEFMPDQELPPHLTSLTCTMSIFSKTGNSSLIFPSSLLSLKIAERIRNPEDFDDSTLQLLPSTLTKLEIVHQTALTPKAVWPPHLLDLSFSTNSQYNDFSNMPSTLTSLKMTSKFCIPTESTSQWIATLPSKSLRHIWVPELVVSNPSDLENLPRHLETIKATMSFHSETTSSLSSSSNPTETSSNRLIPAHYWPPNLSYLILAQQKGMSSEVTPSFLQSLPSSLTRLSIVHTIPASLLNFLPPSVTILDTTLSVTGREYDAFLKREAPDSLAMPTTITYLSSSFGTKSCVPPNISGEASADASSSGESHPDSSISAFPPSSSPSQLPLTNDPPKHLHHIHFKAGVNELRHEVNVPLAIAPNVTSLQLKGFPQFRYVSTHWQDFLALKSLSGVRMDHRDRDLGLISKMTNLQSLGVLDLGFVNPEDLVSFPPHLTELTLSSGRNPWQKSPFPLTLRKLSIGQLESKLLKPLKNLEYLSADISSYQTMDLPPSLTHLRMPISYAASHTTNAFLDAIIGSKPSGTVLLPNLVKLEGQFCLDQTSVERLAASGRKLEVSRVMSVELSNPINLLRPDHISTLGTMDMTGILYQAVMEHYPHLQGLKPENVTATHWPHFSDLQLPPTLTQLHLPGIKWEDNFPKAFPATLMELDITNAIDTTARTPIGLPPHLMSLSMPAIGFTIQSYANMPRKLTKLKLQRQAKFGPKHAAGLPPTLHHLTLDIANLAKGTMQALPPSLRELDFGNSAIGVQDGVLRTLPPNITHLAGSLTSVSDEGYIEIFSQMPTFSTGQRRYPSEELIRNRCFLRALSSSTLDELAAHFTNLPEHQ